MTTQIAALLLALSLSAILAGADKPSDALYAAIRANDLSRLQALLKKRTNANWKDDHGVTPLMYAATVGSPEAMKLLLDKGADANAANAFGSTALMWSATDITKVRLLLDRGAGVNAASKQGRTALLLAAMSDGSADIVRLLLAKGANPKAADKLNVTTLTAAAMGNDTETLRLLINTGVDVNAAASLQSVAAIVGENPLLNAAINGNLEAVKLLLAKGADVNAAGSKDKLLQVKNGPLTLGGFTPLLLAAAFGPAEVVQTLLEAGADVNAKDVRGMTPLMLATATDRQDPEIIRMLLARGADVKAKSLLGETALDWARKIGPSSTVEALQRAGALESAPPAISVASPAPVDLKPAVERSIALLEKSTAEFFRKSGCVACHAQNLTDLAVGVARARKIAVDERAAGERRKVVKAINEPAAPMLLERMDPPVVEILSYMLVGLAETGYTPDRMTDAMVANIAAQQWRDGRWHAGGIARPPFEEGDIFRTALGLRALKVYGPPGRGAEMQVRIGKAAEWLRSATPATAEDRSMQLLGLYWGGADPAILRKLAAGILATQRADGGWAQRAELESDAYATGESLFALAMGGVPPTDAAYQKGVQYLLSTQRADGSWYVRSRSPKFQPYFESGFPYGHDQWISSAATCWATMALAVALGETPHLRAAK